MGWDPMNRPANPARRAASSTGRLSPATSVTNASSRKSLACKGRSSRMTFIGVAYTTTLASPTTSAASATATTPGWRWAPSRSSTSGLTPSTRGGAGRRARPRTKDPPISPSPTTATVRGARSAESFMPVATEVVKCTAQSSQAASGISITMPSWATCDAGKTAVASSSRARGLSAYRAEMCVSTRRRTPASKAVRAAPAAVEW